MSEPSEGIQRARPIKRQFKKVENPSLQPSPRQASIPMINVSSLIKNSINQLLTNFSFYTENEQLRVHNPTYKQRIRNSLYEINQLYKNMYLSRDPKGDFLEKYNHFRKNILNCIEEIGHSIINSKNTKILTNIGNNSGRGATGEFKKIVGDNTKGYKIVKSSKFIDIGKLFIEYFIHKYLNKIQRENESEIRTRFGYLPIPTIYQMNRLPSNYIGLKMNRVLGKSLAQYLQEDFIHFTEEQKLDRLKDILRNLSNILMIFQEKISFTHGDLTPSNIMIHESGNIYLIDFRKSLIIPNNSIYTSETMCLEPCNIDTMKPTLKSMDISLLYFTLIQHYYMFLDEICMQYLVDIILGNGLYELLCNWFRVNIVESEVIDKNAGISTIFYTFMFYALLKEESYINNYIRQINKCGEVYSFVQVDRILGITDKTAPPESGNRGIPGPLINNVIIKNFMKNIYQSKIPDGSPSKYMYQIFKYPEHIVCRTISFRINFYLLLSTFLSVYENHIIPRYPDFFSQFNSESFITKIESYHSGGKKIKNIKKTKNTEKTKKTKKEKK
jgi:thiamine kinase-like enzyme